MKLNPSLIPRFNIDYRLKDMVAGLGAIFLKKEMDDGVISSIFSTDNVQFANYSRTGICLILQSLKLSPGSKIGVPLYSCTVVFDAIIKAGHVPKFIDINENYTIDPNDLADKVHEIDALIVIHTFGRPADMDLIKEVASDIPIIEDCAHSIFSEYKDTLTGLIGDYSCFSLPKYLSAGGGGMIFTNTVSNTDDLKSLINSSESPSLSEELMHIMVMYARAFFYHKPWFGLFALPIGLSIEGKVDLMDKKSFDIKKINCSDKYVAIEKLKKFDAKVSKQRDNSMFLLNELRHSPLTLPFEKPDTLCNYYLFPILVPEAYQRDLLCDYLRSNGVDSSTLFSHTPEIAGIKYGYEGDCSFTEDIAGRILTIPNHYTLSKKELSKIVSLINAYSFQKKI
jgi:dTDP-4-amino-4,6-dideoxygalactose transaminase